MTKLCKFRHEGELNKPISLQKKCNIRGSVDYQYFTKQQQQLYDLVVYSIVLNPNYALAFSCEAQMLQYQAHPMILMLTVI